MNRAEVTDLLTLIEGFERRAFPRGATDAWLTIMADVEYPDAAQAVVEHFDTPEPLHAAVQPGPLKRRAKVIAEVRERAARRAIEPAPVRTEPNEEYRAALAALAAKVGQTDRRVRRPMRADASRPTSADSGITEEVRARYLRALDLANVA
jgi:hypothetical protein